jgi:2-polyprenyl-3-methyl-5-hydroxy-6-metoxy-1,4-benzoquinol methylase
MTMKFEKRVRRKNEFDASLVYGTRKFNLLTQRDKHAQYRKSHDSDWILSETSQLDPLRIQDRNCPLCKTNDHEELFTKSGFPHVVCKQCSLVYVTPILTEEESQKLYVEFQSYGPVLESKESVELHALEADYCLDILNLYLPDKAANAIEICDIGCGPGGLLMAARNRGHRVYAIEPNKKCQEILAANDIEYLDDFFPFSQVPDRLFDSVFLLNTLEHLKDPLETVKSIGELLTPGGLIYLSVPNFHALVNRVLHEKGGTFGGHSHIQHFTSETLSRLLEQAGFEVLEFETIITELGTIQNYLSYKEPYYGEDAMVLDFISPEAIYRNHLGRSLNIIGRKIG